jgi:thiosulfate/3-mercaptopyruvate sulfurtransferase
MSARDLERWLVANGFSPRDLMATVANSTTPLMKASHAGDAAMVRALLRAGVPLNTRNADGNNALWLACVSRNLEVIGVLIEAGIDLDNRNDNGATCLMFAASTGSPEVLSRLLAAGADTRHETLDGFSALDMASTLDCLQLLRRATPRVAAAVEQPSC